MNGMSSGSWASSFGRGAESEIFEIIAEHAERVHFVPLARLHTRPALPQLRANQRSRALELLAEMVGFTAFSLAHCLLRRPLYATASMTGSESARPLKTAGALEFARAKQVCRSLGNTCAIDDQNHCLALIDPFAGNLLVVRLRQRHSRKIH